MYTRLQRTVAVLYGVLCHAGFAAGIGAMMVGIYSGLSVGRGPFHGVEALIADLCLLIQFPVLHSFLLSPRGLGYLSRLAPLRLGRDLSTTTYALISSLQLLLTFSLWSPLGGFRYEPHGLTAGVDTVLYAASWLFLFRTMADAGLGVQTGFLGWAAVTRGHAPVFKAFVPRGTFLYVRQPIYLAFTLTLWTGPAWTPDHVLLAILWTGYCVFGPLLKEQRYTAYYGERFRRYCQLVPRWLPSLRPLDVQMLNHSSEA